MDSDPAFYGYMRSSSKTPLDIGHAGVRRKSYTRKKMAARRGVCVRPTTTEYLERYSETMDVPFLSLCRDNTALVRKLKHSVTLL